MAVPEEVVVVGYGEIGSKSGDVRRRMTERLATNVRAVLSDRTFDATVTTTWARLYVEGDDVDACARAASEVPGVVWARPAVRTNPELDAITDGLRRVAGDVDGGGETFAVRARTAESTDSSFSGSDIEDVGGSALLDELDWAVDLDAPDETFCVECRGESAYVSAVQHDGPGGLPVGTQGTVVALVSGGIDSPVAAWHLLRRGCPVVPLYVDLGPYGGPDHRGRAIETTRRLARRAPNFDVALRVADGGPLVERVVDSLDDTRMLSLRRAMLRMAEAVAPIEDAHAVATGEMLGQKSSQTGPNLAVTDAAVDVPVYRPLLTRDKEHVVATARRLGTFDDSTLPVGCDRIAPSHPVTAATLREVVTAEPAGLLDDATAVGEAAARMGSREFRKK